MRACIISDPGCDLLIADFSNQELRILADLTECTQLLQFFADEVDVHSETARMMLDLGPEVDVRKETFSGDISYRDVAKKINFGLIYGMRAAGLARELGVSKEQAESLMEQYFDLYPEVKAWMEQESELALQNLSARTRAGWERTFDPLPPESREKKEAQKRRQAIERIKRQGPNTLIQGLGAAMTKLAACLFYEALCKIELKITIVAIIHDELVVQAPKEKSIWVAERLADCMDEACRYYLKKVHVPRNEVLISDHWAKE